MIESWDDLDRNQQKGFLIIANYNYGICLEQGNFNYKAIEFYDKNLTLNRCHLNSLLRKAYVLQKIGDHKSALTTLTAAEALFQTNPVTQLNL